MTKVLKFTGIILGIIILLLFVGVGILATCVSPNTFKPIITTQVFKMTGRQLAIDGNLSWSFFPYLGVKVGHASLSNPPEYTQKVFAEFTQATIGIKLVPLLHANIEANGLTLTGLTLNLIKNADGKTNWQDLLRPKVADNNASTAVVQANGTNKQVVIGLAIPSVDVNDAHVTWTNLQTKQYADMSHFEFHAKDISLNHAFPIDSHFDFDAKNPDLSGQGSLGGKITLNLNQQLYLIQDLALSISAHQGAKKFDLAIAGDVTANLNNQTLAIENFVGTVANLTLKGKVNISDLSTKPQLTGHLQAQPFDLKQLLQSVGQDNANLQVAKNVSADFDFSTNAAATKAIQMINMNGNIKVDELQAAKIKLTEVNVVTQLQNGELNITPITASLYQGKLQSQAKINLNDAEPAVSLQAKLSGVQAESLLSDLGANQNKIKIMGAGNIDLQVTTKGLAGDAVVRNLNGTVHFSFNDGKVDGINVGFMIDSAYALLKGKSAPAENEKSTHFGTLTGSAVIQNGVITNKDLFMNSPRFDTSGQGTINLVTKQINYTLEAMPKLAGEEDKNPLSLNHLAIPVLITGSLQNPSIVPDTGAIAKEIANAELKKAEGSVQNKLQDQIKNKLSGPAGDLLKNFLGK
ncbi:MAG: AsmA family protein [Gammaproteobacteria bacterium]|nr:AsmA family protein [Gammaproteobacteria bacterium]